MSLGGNLTPGRFKAECERDGSYKRIQCDKISRFCWCTDENGMEIPRSQSRARPTCGTMGKKMKLKTVFLFLISFFLIAKVAI
jgi:hypothetical protein